MASALDPTPQDWAKAPEPSSAEPLEEQFKKAVALVQEKPASGKKVKESKENMLKMYALFKQATEGPCKATAPSKIHLVKYAKWVACMKCGNMSKEEAMKWYVAMVKKRTPAELRSKL
eukprot:GDKJ01017085.1.p1 GENE.GDKJ01017085.1~~GDKJ01017085.1.p1  ORF type:complete len:118 (-),score=9.98 GDKJ01017085.1:54-407(-)